MGHYDERGYRGDNKQFKGFYKINYVKTYHFLIELLILYQEYENMTRERGEITYDGNMCGL